MYETNGVGEAENEKISEFTLLANSTSANSINPGDISKLMCVPGEVEASSNKKENSAAFSNEVTANRKTYREVQNHATCFITKTNNYSLHLLADRGANSGVVGYHDRVIETHPDHKVDIRGM